MKCPRCVRELEALSVGGVEIDVCRRGCGGIWFDQWELQRFDDPDEVADRLLGGIEVDLNLEVDLARKMACPRCGDVVLMRRPFSKEVRVFVDECPACAGIWLDFGELYRIREGRKMAGTEETPSATGLSRRGAAEALGRIIFHRQGGGV